MRAFLARLLGHALEGRVIEHVLPIFHGDGGNGKSTLVSRITARRWCGCDARREGKAAAAESCAGSAYWRYG